MRGVCAPGETRTSATSTPSAEVPLITPATTIAFGLACTHHTPVELKKLGTHNIRKVNN
jgi:hypothetical protein